MISDHLTAAELDDLIKAGLVEVTRENGKQVFKYTALAHQVAEDNGIRL